MAKLLKSVSRTILAVFVLLHIVAGVTDVILDIPETPVQEGETVVIKCTVTEHSTYNMYLKRYGAEDNEEFLVVNNRATALLPKNIAIDIGGDRVTDIFMVTVTIIANRTDAQTYKCWVGMSPSHEDIIARDSGDLKVYYLPGVRYPVCEISGTNKDLVRPAGSDIILDCISEKGKPPVALQWTGPDNNIISPIEFDTASTKTTRVIVTLSNRHDGAVFTCGILRMPGRICRIGPIEISGSVDNPSSDSSYNPGMVVALAILSVVVVIVVAVIVIAVLIQCRQCACDNFNKQVQDDVSSEESRDIDMYIEEIPKPVKKKIRIKRSRSKNNNNDPNDIQYEIAHVPMKEIYPNKNSDPESGENVYSQEVEIESNNTNDSVTPNGKVYPPPPLYPPLELGDTESRKKLKIPLDDELSISSQTSDDSSHSVQNEVKEADLSSELPVSNEIALFNEVPPTEGASHGEDEKDQSNEANNIVVDVALE